eukprot:TRINITY_DN5683_c0_g1_i1.p1 TRINITY_DN5683_c0_g1~~TRINITY_DN5683_c0_g1_i1.p1  ORF type:complete len:1397 (+),score=419.46 TRINITY_DN5683_c0_g1_i1:393-4193(+)
MVSADESGIVVVWKYSLGLFTPQTNYRKSRPISHVAFCNVGDVIGDEELTFFFSTDNGILSYADDLGHCSDVVTNLNSPVAIMKFFQEEKKIIVVSQSCMLLQLQLSKEGAAKEILRVKLAIKRLVGSTWIRPGILAAVGEDYQIRFFNFLTDSNFQISSRKATHGLKENDNMTSLAYHPDEQLLAVGTVSGRVLMWRCKGDPKTMEEKQWESIPGSRSSGRVKKLMWREESCVLAIINEETFSVLVQNSLKRSIRKDLSVVQLTVDSMFCEKGKTNCKRINTHVHMRGIDFDDKHIVVWDRKKAEVFEVQETNIHSTFLFDCSGTCMAVFNETLYVARGPRVEMTNLQGTVVKGQITVPEGKGNVALMDRHEKFLCVYTNTGWFVIYDISRKVPKMVHTPLRFEQQESREPLGHRPLVGIPNSIRMNCDGELVSVLCERQKKSGLQTRLYVLDMERGLIEDYDFAPRCPAEHHWDEKERNMFSVQSNCPLSMLDAEADTTEEVEVSLFFATERHGIKLQDTLPLDASMEGLVGLQVPKIFFAARVAEQMTAFSSRIKVRYMRDFESLGDDLDPDTRRALLDFSYHISIGNMDAAYRAVKVIQNPSVWENMAHMCIKSKRLDVAEVCLANMGHARGSRAVRLTKQNEPEREAAIAMVAIQIGLIDDAEKLYKQCGRYDLLNKLYQSTGNWSRALEIAQKDDRLHLRNTHYRYARSLEASGDLAGAIQHYESAKTHKRDATRMLFSANDMRGLETYVHSMGDKELLRWWAQLCESSGEFDKALECYTSAGDDLSRVRVLCFMEDFGAAADVILETGDHAASFHLATQHKAHGNIKEAIHFYSQAGRFNHAVKLARETGEDRDLMQLSLQAGKTVMLQTADYFAERQEFDKAVQLYHKGGDVGKALDICFKGEYSDVLRSIVDELDENTPINTLTQCAQFFQQHRQYDKAVDLLVRSKKYHEALDICSRQGVHLTDDVVALMTPPRTKDPEELRERHDLLCKIAAVCRDQGNYLLAVKNYSQADERLEAMRCLIKSGDTQRIIFFAKKAGNKCKEIFILAANYLQSIRWQGKPEIIKIIDYFYQKSQSFEQLSNFYDHCAQSEIDDFRDYEKALLHFRKSLKALNRCRSTDKEQRIQILQQRIFHVDKFVQARKLVKSAPEETVKICHMLLEERNIETALRQGDVFALLIEFYYSQHNYEQALRLIELMKQRRIILGPYLDRAMVSQIYQAMGMEEPNETNNAPDNNNSIEEEGSDISDLDSDIGEEF